MIAQLNYKLLREQSDSYSYNYNYIKLSPNITRYSRPLFVHTFCQVLSAGVLFQSTKCHFGSPHRNFFKAKLDSVRISLLKGSCICNFVTLAAIDGLHVRSDCGP